MSTDEQTMPETVDPAVHESPLVLNLQENDAIFANLTADQMEKFRSFCRKVEFTPGEFLFREGAEDRHFCVIADGTAEVVKTASTGNSQMRVAEVHPGDVLGELKIVDPRPSSASVVAVSPVTALTMDLDVFVGSSALSEIRAIVIANIQLILARRLRAATSMGADAMRRELEENRTRVHAARFIVLMLTMMATYQLAIAALVVVPPSIRPPTPVLSFVFVIWTVIPILISVRGSPFTRESYGLSTLDAGRIAVQSLIWSIPVMLLVVALKGAGIQWMNSMANQQLLDPAALFGGRPFNLGFYSLAVVMYMIHSPLQELVARAGLQGTLQSFVPARPGRINWRAIFISNLLFASAHAFIGFWFCLAAFVPGLFWGWMFARQRSLVGVSVSHIAIGVWSLFVVGVRAIIGG